MRRRSAPYNWRMPIEKSHGLQTVTPVNPEANALARAEEPERRLGLTALDQDAFTKLIDGDLEGLVKVVAASATSLAGADRNEARITRWLAPLPSSAPR